MATALHPTPDQTWAVVRYLGHRLAVEVCWLYRGAFHCRLPEPGWSIAVRPEGAARFRLEACRLTVPCATFYCSVGDWERLASLVGELRAEAAVSV